MKIKEILQFEKEHMNRIRYIVNYMIAPVYGGVTIIILALAGILLSIDEEKYTPAAVFLFVLFGIISILLVIFSFFVSKKEIKIEMLRYNFYIPNSHGSEIYDFSDEDGTLFFNKHGVMMGDQFFSYSKIKVFIDTSNQLNRVFIFLVCFFNEKYNCKLKFDGCIINMIRDFNIQLENAEVLEYILNNTQKAFTQIYKTGHIFIKW